MKRLIGFLAGASEAVIADTLHQLTGLPVGVEDHPATSESGPVPERCRDIVE